VTKEEPTDKKVKDRNPKRNVVQESDALKLLLRIANLLPKSRRISNGGMHPLLMRQPAIEVLEARASGFDVDREISLMFYLQSYVNELPLELQAFVLQDDHLLYVEIEPGTTAPLNDPDHLQRLSNFELLDLSHHKLRKIIAEARERIEIETKLARDRAQALDRAQSTRKELAEMTGKKSESRKRARSNPVWPPDYQVHDSEYQDAGLSALTDRARERFFFVLAAEEILDALVGPNAELNRGLYFQESGAAHGRLFLDQEGRVKYYPPILFSFLVGVQASRVRRCQNCDDYFWAGRSNKKVCSEACGATSRKRAQRKRDLEIKLGDRIPKKRTKERERFMARKLRRASRSAKKGK